MIEVHRLGAVPEALFVNPELVTTIEGHPDVVLTLTNGTKIVVAEDSEQVVQAIFQWRRDLLAEALVEQSRRAA